MKSLERWLAYAIIFVLCVTLLYQNNQVKESLELAKTFSSLNTLWIEREASCQDTLQRVSESVNRLQTPSTPLSKIPWLEIELYGTVTQ